MKKILMALTVATLFHFSADAQSQKKASGKQNFPVCRYGDTYAVCGSEPAGYVQSPSAMPAYRNTSDDTYIEVRNEGAKKVSEEQFRRRHNMVVYDNLQSQLPPYTEPVSENEYRNMNVNQPIYLPPNTGGQMR